MRDQLPTSSPESELFVFEQIVTGYEGPPLGK
jgi:hypothetical protein